MGHRLLFLWTICCLCVHSSLCAVKRQYHSEEELDKGEAPAIFPDALALEAEDMLNTSNIQPGEFVNATELVVSPHVVDLGGKTHEESGNTTALSVEDTCKIPIDWQKGLQDMFKDYKFLSQWSRDPRGVPMIACDILVTKNDTKLTCPTPVVDKTNKTGFLTFAVSLKDVDIKSSDDAKFPFCPQLKKLLARTASNPTFNCFDRIEGSMRITVCHIPKQWLKDQTIITKLNCTNNGNTTTGTETCIISKEIVQKNMTHMMDCESRGENGIECLVSKGWLKYNVFSILTCTEHANDTLRKCIFPNNLLTTDTPTENCAATKDGNSTDCPIYKGINCTKSSNTSKLQCWIPHEWLAEVDNAAKLNCTNTNDNSTQKVCIIPEEWLRGRMTNVSEATTENNNTNETICYVPREILNENSNMTQLNCSSDNLTTTCQIPNEAINVSTVCQLFEQIKEISDALRCAVQHDVNFTTFVCSESEDHTLENETESCNTSTEIINISSTEPETGRENSSTTEDTKTSSSLTTEQSIANVDNSSEISTVAVPYVVDTATENQSTNTSVKLNTEKDQVAPSEGVSYEATETINNTVGIEVAQSSSAANTTGSTVAPGQAEEKSPSPLQNEIVHYEAAVPAAALSQLHTEHTHATVNEQTVTFLRPTESAAILVGVFIAFAVLGYAGLLIWRRMLEKRYGNRQLLINEDDEFSNANNFEMPMYELQERFWPRGVDRGNSSCDNAQKSFNKK